MQTRAVFKVLHLDTRLINNTATILYASDTAQGMYCWGLNNPPEPPTPPGYLSLFFPLPLLLSQLLSQNRVFFLYTFFFLFCLVTCTRKKMLRGKENNLEHGTQEFNIIFFLFWITYGFSFPWYYFHRFFFFFFFFLFPMKFFLF